VARGTDEVARETSAGETWPLDIWMTAWAP
jgi:hypothetical protein